MPLLKSISWLALSAGLLGGCASETSVPPSRSALSRGADPVPWQEIESILNPRQSRTLESLKYTGYVVMDGWIDEDGTVKISRIVESFPDQTRDQLARAFGRKAVIHTPTSASMIKPSAVIYVVFYGRAIEGDIALTFARRPGSAFDRHTGEGYYLDVAQY